MNWACASRHRGQRRGEELSSRRLDPVLGQGRGAAGFGVHPSADCAGIDACRQADRRQRRARQRDRQSAETTIALSHLIFEDARPLSEPEDLAPPTVAATCPPMRLAWITAARCFRPHARDQRSRNSRANISSSCISIRSCFTPEGLRHLVAECGASQVVIGTDYAVPWVKDPVDLILDTPTLSDAERIAILGGTAAKLLRMAS